jgi:hypothetical protein
MKVGHFETAYDYDLSSAFPHVHAKLLDPRQGNYTISSEYDEKALYGYVHCLVTIYPHVFCHPIVYRDLSAPVGHSLSCRTGTWEDFRTKAEIDFIRQYKIGEVKVLDGAYWHPDPKKPQIYPAKAIIDKLLKFKETASILGKHIIKGMLVGISGKTGEYRTFADKVGYFFCTPWRAEFNSQTNLNVARFIYRHKLMPNSIAVATDGVMTDRGIEFTEKDKQDGWKLNYQGEAIVVSDSGRYYLQKHPLSFHFNELVDLIASKPFGCHWEKRIKRIITLETAMKFNMLNQLGTVQEYDQSLDLRNITCSRHFPKYPTAGWELLRETFESTPLSV